MKVKPLQDRIIVEPFKAEETTKGGIIIPDTAKEKPMKGTVRAVGAGKQGEPLVLKVGDDVLFGKGVGQEIEVEEVKYLIMRESDVLLKL
jgi:chaperonin GroES